MKKLLLHIILFFCLTQFLYSQDDGVVAFDIPTRNSLKFNKYTINPTFSFVREQHKYLSFYNKRQWVQFDDAPVTYLASYAGRFKENMGIGIGAFQQDYGVLTTFGGILNFAYNAVLDTDSNLTFGLNLGFYKSGINEGSVNVNFPDPSLQNVPSNSIITVNPGINFGTAFFDFGVSINNAVSYNLNTSEMIEDNPEQSVQGHIMYTGYMNSRGFFDESKFSGLLRSEFKKDQTVISGLIMLTVPKGIWAQAGYNTLYGVSGGLGLNISKQISIEYNYENAMGDLSTFGNSHEITLAYKFENKERYRYSGDDEEQALLVPKKKRKVLAKSSMAPKLSAEERQIAKEKAQARIEAKRLAAQAKAEERKQLAKQRQGKLEAEQQSKVSTEEVNKQTDSELSVDEETNIGENEELAKLEEETKKAEAAKKAEEERLKQEEAARIKAEKLAEAKRLELEAAKIKAAQEAKLKEEAEKKAQEEAARIEVEKQAEAEKLKQAAAEKLDEAVVANEDTEAKAIVNADAQENTNDESPKDKTEAPQNEQKNMAEESPEKDAQIEMIELDGVLVPVPKDEKTRYMNNIAALTTNTKLEQQNLLLKLRETVDSRNQDLKDLKEENDLSEQGIYKAPKAFKSITAENAKLESLKKQIDNVIESQNEKIEELEGLYKERLKTVSDKNDKTNVFYSKTIKDLKSDQKEVLSTRQNLLSQLETIKVATEVERKRRIKRAAYDNEEDRYAKDRATLKAIIQFTPLASEPLTSNDFDSGETLGDNIQIVKNVKNTESGFYVVIGVHSNTDKRDEFLRRAVAGGEKNIDFFFDVNTSKYYIYYQKFNNMESARNAMQLKGSKPYNSNMAVVKIEN